jgi:tetratricopeptide (TPR) repeat protein
MPLGIELAAAWVRMVSPMEIADEIADNLDFLDTNLWDMPIRHRSLRAVFDHSWRLLNDRERHTLVQLAVFRGGFGSAAARDIAGARLPMLAALLDKSLVQYAVDGRYTLHPLLHQFVAKRLAEMPDLARTVEKQHSAYYLRFAIERSALLRGQAPQQAMAELRAEFDNIQQAWHHVVTNVDLNAIQGACRAVADLSELAGAFGAGVVIFEAAVEQVRQSNPCTATPDPVAQHTLGTLLVASARFLTHQAQFERATSAVQEAMALAEAVQSIELQAVASQQWGATLSRQSDHAHAQMQLERALTLAQSSALPHTEIDALLGLGQLALWQGNYHAVHAYHQDALGRCRIVGDRRGEGTALNGLGLLMLWQGDSTTARTLQEQALECYRIVGHQAGEGFVLTCLGHIALGQRSYTEALTFYTQALDLCRLIGDRFGESLALACIGYAPLQTGHYQQALSYYEQALSLHRAIGDRRGESDMLAQIGLVLHLLGDNTAAYERSHQALGIAEEMGNRPFQARALTFLGHAAVELERWEEAVTVYERALELRRALNQLLLALEPLSGLARIALRQGDLDQAQALCTEILAQLATGTLDGMFEPLRVYLTCYHVHQATADPRADDVLSTASRLLHEWAATISDPQVRFSFLNHVKTHHEIMYLHAQMLDRGEVAARVA